MGRSWVTCWKPWLRSLPTRLGINLGGLVEHIVAVVVAVKGLTKLQYASLIARGLCLSLWLLCLGVWLLCF